MSVSVSRDSIEVSPEVVGIPGKAPANISQNADAPLNQSDPEAPAVVQFAISNETRLDTELILEGPVNAVAPLTPTSSGAFTRGLPVGIYRLSSPASFGTTRLAVGPSRVSSNSDLLTP